MNLEKQRHENYKDELDSFNRYFSKYCNLFVVVVFVVVARTVPVVLMTNLKNFQLLDMVNEL